MKGLLLAALLALPNISTAQVAWVGANTHKLTWNSNPPAELVQGYRVYIDGQSNGEAVVVQSDVGLALEVPISAFSLPQGTYQAHLTAYNPAGESDPSATVPFVLALSAPGGPGGVSTPTGLSLQVITP